MHDWWWIWCLGLVLGGSACIGSFLNVVAYRLPRDLAVNKPRWSFCPACETRIRWYHNIPLASYFLLGGRCATCRTRIPASYVHIEALMVLIAIILFDAFFIGLQLDGLLPHNHWSVSYLFYSDWPVYLAYAVLFACLLAMSAIDIQVYWVDIRFTRLATIVGFVAHGLWTRTTSTPWPRPGPQFGWAVLFAAVGALLAHIGWSLYWRRRADAEPQLEPESSEEIADPPTPAIGIPPSALLTGTVVLFTIGMVIHTLISFHGEPVPDPADASFALRAIPGIALAFVLLVGAGAVQRDADEQIEEALEDERSTARRMVSIETLTLLPAVVLGIVGWICADDLMRLWHWQPRPGWQPVLGLSTAASGFVVAGAIGWVVRIAFTLLFGKEAFGVGDIHLMAAAGAVIGWESTVVGYFIATLLALAGWILALPLKRRRAMPMGPWLTLGFFIAALLRDPIINAYIVPLRTIFAQLTRA